jgi:hypothetical protein
LNGGANDRLHVANPHCRHSNPYGVPPLRVGAV